MPKLDFDGHNTLCATYGLHAFGAKCPPQLVKYGLRYYSKPGEIVLDPMIGSGTTLVEARMMGCHGVGYDIDPLARLIAQVNHPDHRPATAGQVKPSNGKLDLKKGS
jgi:hypothetical protein